MKRIKPLALAVIDGWGIAPPWGGNASTLAKTPFLNMAKRHFPSSTLQASGKAVGLAEGERGNSEVGHLTIGSGQIIKQSLPYINDEIVNGKFFENPILIKAFNHANEHNSYLHLLGLVSPGGIHSHLNHLYALIDMAKKRNFDRLIIHAITDGRDSGPFNGIEYLLQLTNRLEGVGKIATISGRYYTMDRDMRWDRIEKAYKAIVNGIGETATSVQAAVSTAYRNGFSDEFIPPTLITPSYQNFNNNDALIIFNFRADRIREIAQALCSNNFKHFARHPLNNLYIAGFTFYQEGLAIEVAFRPKDVNYPLARVIAEANLSQLHLAESEKYAHITYFFNGGHENPFKNENRIVIPSPKVASYDQTPEMSMPQVCAKVISGLKNYDFIIFNLAAPDMVGHTGNMRAAIKSCEAVDQNLKNVFEAVNKLGGALLVTADHGNVEQMVNPKNGEADTEHTANPVFFMLCGDSVRTVKLKPNGELSDVAPTILELLDLARPLEMTGQSLILS